MKTRTEELKEKIKHLNDLMSWTPGWLKSEIKDLIMKLNSTILKRKIEHKTPIDRP